MAGLVRNSFSALEQFDFCERQFFFRRVLKLPEPPSHYLSIGNLYHDCIAYLLAVPGDDPEALVRRLLAKHKGETGWVCPTPDETLVKEVVQNLGRLQTQVFPYLKPRRRPDGTLEIEQWATRWITGKIDLVSETTPVVDPAGRITGAVESRPCVVDWKSKSSTKKRTQEETNRSKQLALYCLEKELDTGAFVEIPRDVAVPINVVVVQFTPEELDYWARWFQAQFAAMQSRGREESAYKLAPPGHPLCSERWCAHWARCPGGGKS